jgi:hypothetical protein
MDGLPVLAAASSVGYRRLPSSRIGGSLLRVTLAMADNRRNVRGVGFAEASKYFFQCFRPITERHQCQGFIN